MKKLVFVLLVFYSSFYAQNPYSIDYNLESGLPTSNIYNSFQDSQGYMWFATDVGVLKFNGYEFELYNTDDGLADNEVFKIFEDSKNRLWFLTLNGKLSYYKNGNFTNVKNSAILKEASYQNMIIDILEDKNMLYFLFRDGKVAIIDINLSKVTYHFNNKPCFSILKTNEDINFLSISSIISLHKKEEIFFDKEITSLNGYRPYSYNGDFYFSSNNKIYQFKNKTFLKVLEIPDVDIIFITQINDEFWIGTRTGLFIKKRKGFKTLFKGDKISSIVKDKDDNFWITTLNNGLKYIPNLDVISHSFGEKRKVNSLQKDKNKTLWIGTNKGLFTLKKGSSVLKLISSRENYIKKIRNYSNSIYAVSNNYIDVFNHNKTKRLLFGSNDILVDDSNYILTSSIVFKFNKNKFKSINDNFKKESFRSLSKFKIFNKRTNVLSKKLDSGFYFGTSTGLFAYQKNNIEKVIPKNGRLNSSILDIVINNEDKDVFIATNSKGVLVLNPKKNIIKYTINSLNGLNSNGCKAIEKHINQSYFVANNKGLNKIVLNDSLKVINFNYNIGLKEETINDIEIIDSVLYLATNKELLSYNLNLGKRLNYKPDLVIDDFIVNNIKKNNFHELNTNENNIKIKYSGISFRSFGDITYEYKFKKDITWTSTINCQLDFKNLPSGKYELQIRAKANDSFSDIKTISFFIKPPFWKTSYFLIISILFVLLIVYLVEKQRVKKMNNRFELERQTFKIKQEKIILEKQMVELKQKALRLQMNPHFIFNALNTIKGYYSGGQITEANRYISKFSRLLRFILENDEEYISLENEIETLQLYIKLVQLRYQDIFDYQIKVAQNINIEKTAFPPLLVQPIVENAIIHGLIPQEQKGILKIDFSIEKNKLVCSIFDSGVGFSEVIKNKNHKSKALQITRERVNFENSDDDKSNFQIIHHKEEKGTTVILKILLKKSDSV